MTVVSLYVQAGGRPVAICVNVELGDNARYRLVVPGIAAVDDEDGTHVSWTHGFDGQEVGTTGGTTGGVTGVVPVIVHNPPTWVELVIFFPIATINIVVVCEMLIGALYTGLDLVGILPSTV